MRPIDADLLDANEFCDKENDPYYYCTKEWLDFQPTLNVKPIVHGKWINAKVGKLFPSKDFKCSVCGNILDFDGVNCGRGDANYCPNCGADMRGDKE